MDFDVDIDMIVFRSSFLSMSGGPGLDLTSVARSLQPSGSELSSEAT